MSYTVGKKIIGKTITKPRGRPVGSTNTPKPEPIPKGEYKNFRVVRYWENFIVVRLADDETEYKIREPVFTTACIKFGYKANMYNSWPFLEPKNTFLTVAFT